MARPFGDSPEEAPFSVGELVRLVGATLETSFSQVLVLGEISALSRASSGHVYFTLSDADASLDAVLWRNDAYRLPFKPRQGDEVVCRGRIGVFGRQGRMQLYVTAMKPVGAGAAGRALEELRQRLAAEGLFAAERKRPLPFLPRTVAIVTSRSGAALHDILVTLRRRFPALRVLLAHTPVQGEEAPRGIVRALDLVRREGSADVVIVGRGGGASEDLAAFNDESVVRAVSGFPVPVISAVGHEVDVSLCDLAADLRAATPTAAAEAAVPVRVDLAADLEASRRRLAGAAHRAAVERRHRVEAASGRLRHPAARVAELRQRADRLSAAIEKEMRAAGEAARRRLAALAASLDALSPLAVLERGYSLASDEAGRLIRDAAALAIGDRLRLRFHRGGAEVRVEDANVEIDGRGSAAGSEEKR